MRACVPREEQYIYFKRLRDFSAFFFPRVKLKLAHCTLIGHLKNEPDSLPPRFSLPSLNHLIETDTVERVSGGGKKCLPAERANLRGPATGPASFKTFAARLLHNSTLTSIASSFPCRPSFFLSPYRLSPGFHFPTDFLRRSTNEVPRSSGPTSLFTRFTQRVPSDGLEKKTPARFFIKNEVRRSSNFSFSAIIIPRT